MTRYEYENLDKREQQTVQDEYRRLYGDNWYQGMVRDGLIPTDGEMLEELSAQEEEYYARLGAEADTAAYGKALLDDTADRNASAWTGDPSLQF